MGDHKAEMGMDVTRVRETQNFQYKPYHNLTLDVTLELRSYGGATEDEMIAEGVEAIQTGFGLALVMIFKRYHENMQDEEIQTYLNAIIPATMKITLKDNEILMDALMLAARKILEKDK